ncbi:hypothetical protein LP109_13465 [Moraxella bovis]|uniref:hypothetical protein n=1 Tax=Moraxella bovis TaxID=476 RepID=UPI002225BF9B|nr:hypothetical protein [Moraxella bovis]UZA16598.1 hypothetical protein LP109_13465 [Moraxella bovis]
MHPLHHVNFTTPKTPLKSLMGHSCLFELSRPHRQTAIFGEIKPFLLCQNRL